MATSTKNSTEGKSMNKESALQEVRTIEARLAELRKIIEQPEEAGLWEPWWLGKYYIVHSNGDTVRGTYNTRDTDCERIAHGNCFQTEAIALKASQLQRVHNHVMRACFQADPDAGEWSAARQYAVFLDGMKWRYGFFSTRHSIPCVHTESQATEACRLLNAWQAKEDAK